MEIRLDSLLAGAAAATGTVVIIDVFRAFTTAAVALQRGAARIVLVADVEEALALRARGIGTRCLGEVGGRRPDGFDFGNSPAEMTRADVRGQTLIQSTRAGTTGAVAARGADQLFGAALVNAAATAALLRRLAPPAVTLVAMGWEGRARTDEDELCALYLRNLLEGRQPDRDAVRSLVRASGEAQKFGDPARPWFQASDLDVALAIDTIPFAIPIERDGAWLVARALAPPDAAPPISGTIAGG